MKEKPTGPLQTSICFPAIHMGTEEDAARARLALPWSLPLLRLLASGCFAFPPLPMLCLLLWAGSGEAAALPPSSLLRRWWSHPAGGSGQDRLGVNQKGPSWFCWCTAGSAALAGVNIRAQLVTRVEVRQQEKSRWQRWSPLHLTAQAGKMFQVRVTNAEHLYKTHF